MSIPQTAVVGDMTFTNEINHNATINQLPLRKTVMTCTSTRQCHKQSIAATNEDLNHTTWLASQRKDVQEYHAARQQAFIRQHDAKMVMSEQQRHIAIKMLIGEAAKYHKKCDCGKTDADVSTFRKQWWESFKAQVDAFLQATAVDPTAASSAVRAIENVSSLGIWFTGDGISMPSRKYAMLAYSHDAQPEGGSAAAPVYVPIVVVGVCQFSYSNYVHEARLHGQTAVLNTLSKVE